MLSDCHLFYFVVYEPPRPQRTTSKATTEICSHDGGACWYVFNLRSQTGLALNHRAVTLRLDLQHYKFHVKCWWTAQEKLKGYRTPRAPRWIAFRNKQRCMQRLIGHLHDLRCDDRQVVLAHGSWGMIAGQPGNVSNEGIPPTMYVGMLRFLARHFPVFITPEGVTSKTLLLQ